MTISVQIKDLKIGSGIPKICVPLTGITEEELYAEAVRVKKAKPDLVEWRADFYENLSEVSKVVEEARKIKQILGDIPLLFTIRTRDEGGNAEISMENYAMLNMAAAIEGQVDLVDVEVFSKYPTDIKENIKKENTFGDKILSDEKKNLIEKLHMTDVKVIASSHDFEKTDAKELLLKKFCEMDKSGADILKMAVMPVCEKDVNAIMEATDEMRNQYTHRPLVSMSMGELGKISRIKGELFGSSITFATVGAASAPGQIPIEILREKLLEISR